MVGKRPTYAEVTGEVGQTEMLNRVSFPLLLVLCANWSPPAAGGSFTEQLIAWLSFRPAGLDDLVAAEAAAPRSAVDARVLRRLCRSFGRAYVAATIAAGFEFVALLCQVRIKVIEDRLVDVFPAARCRFHWLRGLEDAGDIDDRSTAALC